jgi:dTDP-4-amino-4,6-dideoxygalactose transaminase
LSPPPSDENGRHVYHLLVITADDRNDPRSDLAARGIETGIQYPVPVHRQPVLHDLGYAGGAFPNAERLAASSLSIPMYPELPLEQVEQVAAAIRRHYQG